MIFEQLSEQLNYLSDLLGGLTADQYTYRSQYLSGSSIGGHTRHILELLGCAINGYANGIVDYHNRTRDLKIETDISSALLLLHQLNSIANLPDRPMQLTGDVQPVTTFYYREIVYNIEHTIHHLALIKVSLVELEFTQVDPNFGMAYSTIRYNQDKVAAKP